MLDYQQRVVDEKTELDSKLSKLNTFYGTTIFKSMNVLDRGLLEDQAYYMRCYSDILAERIARFTHE